MRADQAELPKVERYKIGDILRVIDLNKATYHDERKRMKNHKDKYVQQKKAILEIAKEGTFRGRLTYGYRRIGDALDKRGIHLCGDTIRKLMSEMGIQVSMYNKHINHHYSSFRGKVGKVCINALNQLFEETEPYMVLHTDVTQVKLASNNWAYISAITDEASKKILAFQINDSPNKELIKNTLSELLKKLPDWAKPIIHSDQGWHYQLSYYTETLIENNLVQSMSRKGNCLDNAPIESFFHIYKTECLVGFPPCKNIDELEKISQEYVNWYNNVRISRETKSMSPVNYREHALAA
ncbi:IS3 family transposase [Companilactobacillus mishanensis]|uniref:IS3 family transposase n=1 Tax=Companilactobacillus mishanensis TaxID=2486008 RepID=UPI0021F06667|nr:IS3 family transposase [Companilactobacillus mishanensis]